MKTKSLHLLASALLFAFVSCTNEMQEVAGEQSQALKQIVMTTQDFQSEADGRTVYQIADGAVKCTWAENDTVGVFPNEGAQAYFPMASGAGTKNATFDGKGWALKDGYTYGAYYPCIGKFYLDRHAVPVSYTGQTQVGNGSMAHLGDYDYMVATPTAPEFGSAQFMFKHLSALVQLKITVPQPVTFTSVKLVTDTKAFAVEGKVDIMADAPVITPTAPANELVLNLQNVATTEENEEVTFYFMLPPADLSGKALKAVLVSDKGNVEVDLEGKNFKAGTAYALSGEMESTEAGYKDGVVTISEAGTMKELLGDDFLNITSLKVVGPINGDDVLCLRQMFGGSEFWYAEGKLASLDLSEASVVEGGGCYYYDSMTNRSYCTSDNAIGGCMFCYCDKLQDILLPVGVTSIAGNAFYCCSSLTSVKIGAGVTSIGHYAFYRCSSLTSVDIPAGVTSIGHYAFDSCSSLTSVTIGAGVTSIGQFAFFDCSSLTSVTLGTGVTSIDHRAFEGCTSLKSVHITDLSAWCNIAFYDSSSNPLYHGKNLYLNNQELTELVIPEGIKEIKPYLFFNCSSLTSVTIGAGVTSIGKEAFRYCSSLKDLYCFATTPPAIVSDLSDYNYNSFSSYEAGTTLHVPKGCVSSYQSSSWGRRHFKTIVELE